MLRKIAEYFSRGMRLKRRLPQEVGGFPIIVSPEAGGLKFWKSDLAGADPILLGLAREMLRPGFVVWDIGANQGVFSFSAAWLAGPKELVIAVEPDTGLADLLSHSCAVSAHIPRATVTIVPLAVSDSIGQRQFHIAERARASNHLEGFGNSQTGGIRQSFEVLTVTLDWLVQYFPAPQVPKINVEGAEGSVFRGGTTLLRKHRPVLICDVNSENSEESTKILGGLAYTIYDGSQEPASRRKLDRCPWSSLAVPEEKR